MKKLTLKHATIYESIFLVLFFAPSVIGFIGLFVKPVGGVKISNPVIPALGISAVAVYFLLLILLLPCGFAIVVMAHNSRSLQRDRKYFLPSRVFSNSREAVLTMKASLKKDRFRFLKPVSGGRLAPELMAAGKDEKILLVYTCFRLDKTNFEEFASDAASRISAVPRKRRTKTFSAVFCILADTVAEDLERKSKKTVETDGIKLFPCLYDCSRGRAYLDGCGYGRKSTESLAQRMLAKHLLGCRNAKLPRKNNPFLTDDYLENKNELENTGLFELYTKVMHSLWAGKKEDREAAKSLQTDGFVIKNNAVYYKCGQKVLSVPFVPDEEDEKRLVLMPVDVWFYPRKRKIPKKQIKSITQEMERFLKDNGYSYTHCEL